MHQEYVINFDVFSACFYIKGNKDLIQLVLKRLGREQEVKVYRKLPDKPALTPYYKFYFGKWDFNWVYLKMAGLSEITLFLNIKCAQRSMENAY